MKRDERGFTLIELMIVVAIIGILAAVAIPNFMNARDRAKIAAAASVLGSLRTALEMYMTDENQYPVDSGTDSDTTASGDVTNLPFELALGPYMTYFDPPANSNWASYEVDSGLADYSVLVQCRDRAPATWLFVRDDTSDIWIYNDAAAAQTIAGVPNTLPGGNWTKYVK